MTLSVAKLAFRSVMIIWLIFSAGCHYYGEESLNAGAKIMTTYIVAVRREKSAFAPEGWVTEVTHTAGVHLESVSGTKRALVQATPDGIRTVREKYGSFLRVEEKIEHSTN